MFYPLNLTALKQVAIKTHIKVIKKTFSHDKFGLPQPLCFHKLSGSKSVFSKENVDNLTE